MKYQLFRIIPNEDIINIFLSFYNISSLSDSKEFTKSDLNDFNTIDKLVSFIPQLKIYYIPCKHDIYLVNIDLNRCITIMRQLIRLYDYELLKREHVQNKIKSIYYHIEPKNKRNIIIQSDIDKCIMVFN